MNSCSMEASSNADISYRGISSEKQQHASQPLRDRAPRTTLLQLTVRVSCCTLAAAVIMMLFSGLQVGTNCTLPLVSMPNSKAPTGNAAAGAQLSNASVHYTGIKEHPACGFFRSGASSATKGHVWWVDHQLLSSCCCSAAICYCFTVAACWSVALCR
jgi:hypothetical protein